MHKSETVYDLFPKTLQRTTSVSVFDSSKISENLLKHFILSFGGFGHVTTALIYRIIGKPARSVSGRIGTLTGLQLVRPYFWRSMSIVDSWSVSTEPVE